MTGPSTDRIVKDVRKLAIVCIEIEENTEEHSGIAKDLLASARLYAKTLMSGCAGLAANQIGYDKRMFVIKMKNGFRVFTNPSFSPCGPLVMKTEGCLSYPGKEFCVKRHIRIHARSGNGKRMFLSGFEAQAFQHELDHLNGVTY